MHNLILPPGFYRINYDMRNWKMLIDVLNDRSRFESIHPINRAQIVDDAMNLALAGRLDYGTALDITSYLVHERSYVPLKAGLVALGYIDTMLSKGAHYLEYKVCYTKWKSWYNVDQEMMVGSLLFHAKSAD